MTILRKSMIEPVDKEYSEAFKTYLDKRFRDAGGGAGGIDLGLDIDGEGIVEGKYKGHKFEAYFTVDPRNRLSFHFSYELHAGESGHKPEVRPRKEGLTRLIGKPKREKPEVPNTMSICYPIKTPRANIRNPKDVYNNIWANALKEVFLEMLRAK